MPQLAHSYKDLGSSMIEEPPLSGYLSDYESFDDSEFSSDDEDSDYKPEDDSDYQPEDLDEPCSYIFKCRDLVWVRTAGGAWHAGRICSSRTKTSATRQGMGTYYPVKFFIKRNHIMKSLAPLNGEIKPDTPHVRSLLKAGGWL